MNLGIYLCVRVYVFVLIFKCSMYYFSSFSILNFISREICGEKNVKKKKRKRTEEERTLIKSMLRDITIPHELNCLQNVEEESCLFNRTVKRHSK